MGGLIAEDFNGGELDEDEKTRLALGYINDLLPLPT